MWGNTPGVEKARPPAKRGRRFTVRPVWVTDLVFLIAPVSAVALAIWGHATADQALTVIGASLGYAAGRPVGNNSQ